MKQSVLRDAEKYSKSHKRKSRWYSIVTCLAAIVVFCTTYALILPAITLEGAKCGIPEHTHSDECWRQITPEVRYELQCTYESLGVHQHGDSCYDENGSLICGYADFVIHKHDKSCFDENGKQICTLPEIKPHQHTDECYSVPETDIIPVHTHTDECYKLERGELTCEEPEEPAHRHTDECYAPVEASAPHEHDGNCYEVVSELTCELSDEPAHTHSEKCYADKSVLICTSEEADHVHGEGCYELSRELICEESEEPAHEHGAECYTDTTRLICDIEEIEGSAPEPEDETPPEPICGLTEDAAHTHTDECYEWNRVLICDLPTEPTEPAEPAEPVEPELICGEEELIPHAHSADCYDSDGNLSCGQLEVSEHIHSDACLHEVTAPDDAEVLTCTLPEDENHTHTARCYGTWELVCELEEHTHSEECQSEIETEVVYVCGKEPHTHGESCLNENDELICELEEHTHSEECQSETEPEVVYVCGKEPHTHGETCLNEDGELICGLEEHTHSEECQSEIETEVVYVCGKEPHTHGETCLNENGELICELEEHTHSEECQPETEPEVVYVCGKEPHTHGESCFNEDGELICELEEHTHSEECSDSLETPAGEQSDTATDDPDKAETDSKSDSALQKPAEVVLSEEFVYNDNIISAVVRITGTAYLPETEPIADEDSGIAEASIDETQSDETENSEDTVDTAVEAQSDTFEFHKEMATASYLIDVPFDYSEAADEVPADSGTDAHSIEMDVTLIGEDESEYQKIAEYMQDKNGEDSILALSVLSLRFYYDRQLLDISDCELTVEITPILPGEAAAMYSLDEIADEAEIGTVYSVMQNTDSGVAELDNVFVKSGDEDVTSPTVTASLTGSNSVFAFSIAATANPHFTVQYYANLTVAASTGSNPLKLIDTSGKKLPQNGNLNPPTKEIYLTQSSADSNKYKVATTTELTEIYSSQTYQYIFAPNLTYFNKLYENGNYVLKEIWVKSSNGTNTDSWVVYEYNKANNKYIHFTNRAESVNDNTILITDGTVIRLVFDTSEGVYTNAVNFYDYDITEDGVHTKESGINKNSNYIGYTDGMKKLAFGNTNTDTGLGELYWNGNQLNKYNTNGYNGCTFGLVTGYSDGKIQYASGIVVPNLFNDGNATGKKSYDTGQYSLSFNRNGDTYTLSSVNNTSVSGLEYFNHPNNGSTTHTHIWTNNFWPMDSEKNTDPHTGASGNLGTYIGASGTEKNYPISDDGIAHNNMFGMHYKVQFKLTEDYIGPLEYYFFGDDDMWVFLDGQLVCDIGGVHSSVGEYVNLWDYINNSNAGTHTLDFFYTERGLSGSTCYMQFTLPSVSSVTPEQNTGNLRVEKKVSGGDSGDEEFHFDIKFTDANGKPLPDDYSYTRYTSKGEIVKQDVIIYDGGSFELKAGEYVEIKYLPYGTKYTITEETNPCYETRYSINGESKIGYVAQGSIIQDTPANVTYTNIVKPMLPQTGGIGTTPYTIGGLVLIASSALLLLYRKSRRGKDDAQSS